MIAQDALPIEVDEFDLATHNGCVTLYNPATGNHVTVWVRTQKQDSSFFPGQRLVHEFVGSDNNSIMDYQSFGVIGHHGKISIWKAKRNDNFYVVLAKMLEDPKPWAEHKNIRFDIEARCRRCNRKLTNPDSIQTGLGPECASKQWTPAWGE